MPTIAPNLKISPVAALAPHKELAGTDRSHRAAAPEPPAPLSPQRANS